MWCKFSDNYACLPMGFLAEFPALIRSFASKPNLICPSSIVCST